MMLSTILSISFLLFTPQELLITRVAETPKSISQFSGVAVTIDKASLDALPIGDVAIIPNFPLDLEQDVTLRLQRFDVFAPDAELVVASLGLKGKTMERHLEKPQVALFKGTIEGDPYSRVFIAVGDHTTNGLIESQGRTYVLAKNKASGMTVVYDLNEIRPSAMNWVDFQCDVLETSRSLLHQPQEQKRGQGESRGGGCEAIKLAIDTDWEFTNDLFAGDVNASSEYAVALIGAISFIYQTDVNVGMQISYLRLWNSASDPWDGPTTPAQLKQFRQYWIANMSGVTRHLAHLLSGRNLGGGIAYLSSVCSNFGYAVSANLNGSFPQPTVDHHQNNWDPFVVAHELGHNCGTVHTHDYDPIIDGCGLGDCTDAYGGTIMSYCHQCSGGMSNIVLSFHPIVQITIINYLTNDIPCSIACDPAIPGGCCIDVSCSEIAESDCLLLDGVFLGTGTLCATGGCDPIQPGACCTDGLGACVEMNADACLTQGGSFLGIGTTCASGWCNPNAQFACCINGSCSDLSSADCNTAGGYWVGIGSSCAGGGCDPLENDFCTTAKTITTGVWDFSNVGAITDTDPFDNLLCNTDFLGGVYSDVWYAFTACETGQLLVSTCNLVDFDSDIVVYQGTCANKVQVACNGDSAGCAGFTSEVTLDVLVGEQYLIRVGGFSDQSIGRGQIVLGGMNCQPDIPCLGDITGNGQVDKKDDLSLIDHWGETSPEFDIDENGIVGTGDLLIIIANWGICEV